MTVFRCERLWVGLPAVCLDLLCARYQQLAPGGANQQLGGPGHANGRLLHRPPWQFQGSTGCSFQHFSVVQFSTHSQTNNRVVVLIANVQRHVFSCFSSVFTFPFFYPSFCSQSGRALWCSPVRLLWSSSWCSRNRSSSAATATWTHHTESRREDALVWNMIQQKRWNTTSSNRKFPALPARGGWRRWTMWSDRLKTNRSPDRRGTCSPLLSSISSLTHSVCLSPCEGVQAPDLSRCSARSRCRTLTLRGTNSLWLPPRFLWGSKVILLSHLDLRLWTRHPHATCLNRRTLRS